MLDHVDGLAAHEARVARDLELLLLPPANWTAPATGPAGEPVLDVLVVGAGMYGIAATAALGFKGLRNILMLDRAPEGQEGPWVTTARMETLPLPEAPAGGRAGIPSLTFRAWFEARSGTAAWAPTVQDLQCRLAGLPDLDPPRAAAARGERGGTAAGGAARRVAGGGAAAGGRGTGAADPPPVLATGRGGTGGFTVPPGIDPGLLPDLAAHGGGPIDFAALRGRRVAVIGGGPTAWDNAATALEAGAARVDMFVRRAALPQVNKGRGSAHPGFFEGWATLPPAEKWRGVPVLHARPAIAAAARIHPPRAAAGRLPHPSWHAGAGRGAGRARCGSTSAAAGSPRPTSSSSAPATASMSRASPNWPHSPRASPPGPTASPRRRGRRARSSPASPGWGRGSS